jgi:hypothetical protein
VPLQERELALGREALGLEDGVRTDAVHAGEQPLRLDVRIGIEVIGSGNHFKDNHATQNTNDGLLGIAQGGPNSDDGKNTGDANGGLQCQIDGAVCKL